MSQPVNTGFGEEEESDSTDLSGAASRNFTECSLSRCASSASVLTDAMQAEHKSLEGSTSSETAWTDSKHSSYLDFMEASFVRNMFARSYCMEDVCGETAYHHYHQHHQQQQCQSHTIFEENDYDSAQSRFHPLGTLELISDGHDWRPRPALRSKASAGVPTSVFLANPWVKHFRPRKPSSDHSKISALPSKRNDKIGRRDAYHLVTSSSVVNSADQDERRSNSITACDEPKKVVGKSLKKTSQLEAGQIKDCVLSYIPKEVVFRSISKNKRRVLWSTYKQLHKTRRETGNYVQHRISVNQEDVAAANLTLDSVLESDLIL